MSSTSDPAAGGDTLGQQRGFERRTSFQNTIAYTGYGVAETFGSGPQGPSGNKQSPYPSTIDHRDLQGERSQTSSASSMQRERRTASLEEALACPYHRNILQSQPTNSRSGQGLHPKDRYVAEGSSERYAILRRSDAGNGSTHNGCRCLEIMQSSADSKGKAH